MTSERIASVDEVPADGTFLFRVESVETGDEREAVLVRTDGREAGADGCADDEDVDAGDDAVDGRGEGTAVAAWLNY